MDIDLRLPSEGQDRLVEEPNTINNLLCNEDKLHIEEENGNMLIVAHLHNEDGITFNSPTSNLADLKEDVNLEPLPGMEFVSHQEAYAFYQEYARSMGFNTAIQNSRRSKTSREFIDAKFACSRYGTKREYDKGNRPRVRQITKQEPESAGRRSCGKTDCKASMHVKRRPDGKWVIHSFVKEHNHELLPAQAVSEQTRKIYAAMARQYAEYKSVVGLKSETRILCDKNRNLVLEVGDAKRLLGFFTQMQNVNSNFFHAVELGDDLCLKSFLWIDAKGRHDYSHFCDVVAFDTTYIRNKYKIPLALLIGVNQHYQFLLLGCAVVSDESFGTYSWIMQTWLKAMGGQAPKVILTEQDGSIKSAVSEVFPNTRHCFYLWHILGRVSDNLGHIIKKHDKFMEKFEKWIYRSWTDEEFEKRWHKLITRFGLEKKDEEYLHSLYEDRKLWVPTYMKDTFLAGMSTIQRSESINYYFDKYVHKKTTVSEFLNQYETIIQDRYEEEARADSDTWNKQPALKSPSPVEKQMSNIYTHAIFKKFQIEVLGTIACHPKKEGEDESTATFRVKDSEKNQDFIVTWNEVESEVCCICHLFEYKGFLCRHGMIVLQICGFSTIPSQCILKRWTKDAKERHLSGEGSEQVSSRVQRYNLLCNRAIRLGEEGSLSQESYNIALRALDDAFTSCMSVNNACKIVPDAGTSAATNELLSIEDDCPSSSRTFVKTTKKKNPSKKRKMNTEAETVIIGAQDSFQSMEKLNPRPATSIDGFYGTQQSVQGMVQLNLLGPTRNNYYGNHPTIQGLGQLNSIAPNHDGYYGQQSMHGLGQMDFFRTPPGFAYGIREEPNVRSAQLHDDGTKRA